jgi:hypothetical protein
MREGGIFPLHLPAWPYMYDTVTLVIRRPPSWEMPSIMTRVRPFTDQKTGAVHMAGFLGSMSISDRSSEVLISGSLPRYLCGSNAFTMTRAGTKEAIERMSNALSLPLGEARAYRLDMAGNIVLRHPVGEYLATLGPWKQANRKDFSNGNISYQGGRCTLNFYDKILDLNRKSVPIPDHWENRNVLRVELQMKKAVKDQIGRSVFGRDLWNEDVYHKAIQKWKDSYLSVEKLKLMEEMPMGSVKSARAYFEYLGIQTLGYDNTLQRVRMAKSLGQITIGQAKEIRRALRKIMAFPKGEAKGLIEELNREVESVAACHQ